MKNRESFLFSMILLLINTVGAAGALLNILGVHFGTALHPALFLWGMFFLCLLSGGLWSTRGRRRMALQWFLLTAVSLVCVLAFRKGLAEGLGWSLGKAVKQINERYGIHMIWNLPQRAELAAGDMESTVIWATWSILAVMLPLVLLLGYAVVRKRVMALLLADAVWFVAACTMDRFPAYVWLVLCILGLAAVIIRNAFREDEGAGVQAVLLGTVLLGLVMALVYRFAVPFMDSRYDAFQEARIDLNRKVNEEWIPGIKRALARFGSGSGTDVTGSLTRKTGTAYTSEEIYRVTFSYAPKSAVYLRGFVGRDYGGDKWEAARDADLEKYYRREGWELPESGSDLVNLTYNAFRYRASEKVWVEELAGPGNYTVYPYGARLTEDYRVHWDGTAERERKSWELFCSAPEDYSPERRQTGVAAEQEARYRAYVYDTFCEYPAEDFPRLTDFLKTAGFRQGSIYDSLRDVLAYLKGNAVYDLDVPNTPRGQDFVEYFLFESRAGYCAHFASSAVLILRSLGIPARYVTGYAISPGDFTQDPDGTYSAVVMDKQAHAWAEVYLDGIGWIPVEMTPGAAPFPRDNTAQQLALAGQLTGESGSGEAVQAGGNAFAGNENGKEPQGAPGLQEDPEQEEPGQPGTSGEGEQQEDPEQEEPGQSGASGQGEQQENPEQEAPGQSGASGQGEQHQEGPGEDAGTKQPGQSGSPQSSGPGTEQPERGEEGKGFGRLMAALARMFQAAVPLVFLAVAGRLTWVLTRRSSREKLERAEGREKVFLLYRNMRRLLAVSGCPKRLMGTDEDTAEFNRLLEKCGFGEKEPAPEELQAARSFCEKLAKETCAALPVYRKLLFHGLDVYGLAG